MTLPEFLLSYSKEHPDLAQPDLGALWQAARAAQLEADCQELCGWCGIGYPVIDDEADGYIHVTKKKIYACEAASIRVRAKGQQ